VLAALWLKGMFARLPGRLLGAIVGVALTVALLTSIGAFVASSADSMTRRAIAGVPVDWQIQLAPGADVRAAVSAIGATTQYGALERVGYADVAGLTAAASGTVQTTGPGKVVGLSPQYHAQFPSELRLLVGSLGGVLVAQQTAANLRVTVGDRVTIRRIGRPPVTVTVGGVVDLPFADSFFQVARAPAGAAPQAPPDNVLVLPLPQWHRLFDPQAGGRPDTVQTQLHVRIAQTLPAEPTAAYTSVQQLAHHLEARIAGSGAVIDNLAARLLAVRADALYARVLFVFLGLPGAILAVLLTLAVAASGADRRRREQALLRTRGASITQLLRLESLEALAVGIGGVALGLILAALADRLIAPSGRTAEATTVYWAAGAALAGLVLAVAAVLYPAWAGAQHSTVAEARAVIGRAGTPLWQQVYLDVTLLAISAAVFWQMARSGYAVVVAPEGVPQSLIAYQAFVAPLFLWIGAALLAIRLSEQGLARARRTLAGFLRPVAHGLGGVVAASLGRQRVRVARGVVLVAIAVSFAISTAVFNTTYQAQSIVDAQLTTGADVTVTAPPTSALNSVLAALRQIPGVVAAQPMLHRFAYVGNDLQDLYGIDPVRLGEATTISNAYFAGGDARAALAALAAHPDGVLVSAETVVTYQLSPGDRVNLRLQRASDRQYHVVPFHFVGIVREFPTAPKDSFLVANAGYIAQRTGTAAVDVVLLRTAGSIPEVAVQARGLVRSIPGAAVTDINSTQGTISSSLTAVDLRGLTRLELIFAVLLVAGATGLILALGLAERRRTFAILAALGAADHQLGAFLWSEALVIAGGGALIGTVVGFGMAQMLVTLLTGVFDPPPQSLSVPWIYLAVLAAAAIASVAGAVLGAHAVSRRSIVDALRNV